MSAEAAGMQGVVLLLAGSTRAQPGSRLRALISRSRPIHPVVC